MNSTIYKKIDENESQTSQNDENDDLDDIDDINSKVDVENLNNKNMESMRQTLKSNFSGSKYNGVKNKLESIMEEN